MFNKSSKIKKTDLSQLPIQTLISNDVTITGEIKGDDAAIRIDGKVKGNVSVEKGIILGENAEVLGDLTSSHIMIHGTLTGNISCKELQLKATGIINGNIVVESLEIEIGGKYNGTLKMTGSNAPVRAGD